MQDGRVRGASDAGADSGRQEPLPRSEAIREACSSARLVSVEAARLTALRPATRRMGWAGRAFRRLSSGLQPDATQVAPATLTSTSRPPTVELLVVSNGSLAPICAEAMATRHRSSGQPSAAAQLFAFRRQAAAVAHLIFGTACDETPGRPLRVTVIATSLSSVARKNTLRPDSRVHQPFSVVQPQHSPQQHHTPQQALRTGSDKLPILNQAAQPQATPGNGMAPAQHDDDGMDTPGVG
jgi:hypothetical protein